MSVKNSFAYDGKFLENTGAQTKDEDGEVLSNNDFAFVSSL